MSSATADTTEQARPARQAIPSRRYPPNVVGKIIMGEYRFPTRRLEPPEAEKLATVTEAIRRFYAEHLPKARIKEREQDVLEAVFLAGAEYGVQLTLQNLLPLAAVGYPLRWVQGPVAEGCCENLVWNLALVAQGEIPAAIPRECRTGQSLPVEKVEGASFDALLYGIYKFAASEGGKGQG